jgi:hypothetical protein
MNDKGLDIFGPTICTQWSTHNLSLKKDLIDHLVSVFSDSFNKIGVTSLDNTCLKILMDKYRVHLKTNPRYERPLMILEVEWKNILEDEKEKTMRKEGNTPPGQGRYIIFLI